MSKVENVVIKEDDIDKIVECAEKKFVGEIISDLGLEMADGISISMEGKDFKDLISDVFGYGARIGVYSMLEILDKTSDKAV